MEKIYRHFKGGYYRFITEVTNSETQEKEVVYQALYGKRKVWTRPAGMFYGKVNVDGSLLRFSICSANPRPYFHTLGATSSSDTA